MGNKILTVDDSKTIRMIVGRAFKSFDCEVFEACNGVEGLSVASREKPNIIILDYTMPIMDGFEMLTKLKSDPELKSIPVIMLTAEAGRENVLKIAKTGVRDYLVKPFKEDVIIERVGRVIDLKPKGEAGAKTRRFDDALNLLVVDDKPAIIEQIRAGLSETTWNVAGCGATDQAVEHCDQKPVDVVLISLSLPDSAGFTLFQSLRASPKTKTAPVFALSVKTAVDGQSRAQQLGFTGIMTKPIDFEDLKLKITRSLGLDTSYKYFERKGGVLLFKLPATVTPVVSNDVSLHLRAQITEAVDSGLDRLIMDFSKLKSADINLVKLGLQAIQLCQELAMRYNMVGLDVVRDECKNYEESKDWRFVSTVEQAAAQLAGKSAVAA